MVHFPKKCYEETERNGVHGNTKNSLTVISSKIFDE